MTAFTRSSWTWLLLLLNRAECRKASFQEGFPASGPVPRGGPFEHLGAAPEGLEVQHHRVRRERWVDQTLPLGFVDDGCEGVGIGDCRGQPACDRVRAFPGGGGVPPDSSAMWFATGVRTIRPHHRHSYNCITEEQIWRFT